MEAYLFANLARYAERETGKTNTITIRFSIALSDRYNTCTVVDYTRLTEAQSR